ncbi:unnamed protein product [Symbiodinium microadriaticum]|nr:unnamed protein product [Symbiodinium microadriaticum]
MGVEWITGGMCETLLPVCDEAMDVCVLRIDEYMIHGDSLLVQMVDDGKLVCPAEEAEGMLGMFSPVDSRIPDLKHTAWSHIIESFGHEYGAYCEFREVVGGSRLESVLKNLGSRGLSRKALPPPEKEKAPPPRVIFQKSARPLFVAFSPSASTRYSKQLGTRVPCFGRKERVQLHKWLQARSEAESEIRKAEEERNEKEENGEDVSKIPVPELPKPPPELEQFLSDSVYPVMILEAEDMKFEYTKDYGHCSIAMDYAQVGMSGAGLSMWAKPSTIAIAVPAQDDSTLPGIGWPLRGVRIGEAGNPGPPDAMEVDADPRPGRVYCPVQGCPCADPTQTAGYASIPAMRSHIDSHLAGTLQGDVPQDWMQTHNRVRCMVCGLSVSSRHGVHPTCMPAARAAAARGTPRQAGPDLPDFHEIMAADSPVLRHVPHAARHLWGQVLMRALANVAHHNDSASWRELLMLPRCVLHAPPRGGRRHNKATAAYTLDRLQQWLQGERRLLWDSRTRSGSSRRTGQPSAEDRRALATSLAREGLDRKACTALLSAGLCPETPQTVQALRALHPVQAPPIVPGLAAQPLAPELVPEAVSRALRSFPADTAPGPSGLRVQHLREACAAGASDALLQQLASVVGLLAQGQACREAAASVAGASPVAVPKPKGGVRPIAVGEVLRRLTGKCLMAAVRDDAKAFFCPAQLGIAARGGAEAAVHTTRAWVTRHQNGPGKVLVKLDFRNAFNTVSRQAALDMACSQFPALARFVNWCYCAPADLYFGATRLASAAGVQQGDPLGPLLFAAALQPLAQELRRGPLDLAFFYLDDGVLAGDIAAVGAALAYVQQKAAQLGLHLNLAKCEAVVVGTASLDALWAHLPAELLKAQDGTSRLLRNFELLGAPIGEEAFTAGHVAARVDKAATLLEAIGELEDPQVGLRLLRSCAGHVRIVHSMRCAPPGPQRPGFLAFDTAVRSSFGALTGIHLDDQQWRQAARGPAMAGLGLRSTALDAPAAYLASIGGSRALCAKIDEAFSDAVLLACPHAAAAADQLNSALQPHQQVTIAAAILKRQKELTELIDTTSWRQQLANSTPTARALLLSEAEVGARAFLAALPRGSCRLEPALFVSELRQRLGVPDAAEDTWCPLCNAVLDRYSHHAALCCAGGERNQRHHALRDLVYHWATRAGMQPEREKAGLLLPQRPEDTALARRRPADVYLPCLRGSPTALDLAVTAPQRLESLAQASQEATSSAGAYAQTKADHLQTARVCAEQGVRFQPMVVECTGAWDKAAAKVLWEIARAVAAREGADGQALHGELLQELGVTARRFRARAILRRRAELGLCADTATATAGGRKWIQLQGETMAGWRALKREIGNGPSAARIQAVSDAGQGPGRSCAIAVGQDFDSFAKNTSSVQTLLKLTENYMPTLFTTDEELTKAASLFTNPQHPQELILC